VSDEQKYIVDPYEAHDPYRWQRAENEANRNPQEKLDLPPMRQYSELPSHRWTN
jgi:hypothetical protein